MLKEIKKQAKEVAEDLCAKAKLKKGQVVIVGCSTSEILGDKIGTNSSPEAAEALFEGIYGVLSQKGIYLAAQCCEHLNRAIIVERECAGKCEEVNVVPVPKAGGSFASVCYQKFNEPIALEEFQADAGIDIGGTLIGMHLKKVAVPLRLDIKKIGQAYINAARTRPKCIGGARAVYNEKLL